nr:putative late blight resistance protein homolog R1A-10 [Coffea arabica]
MAQAAIVSLVHQLECLMKFPLLILEIKKMQVKAFSEKVSELLNVLEGTPVLVRSRVEQLRFESEPLGRSIGDFLVAVKSNAVVSDVMEIMQRLLQTHLMSENMQKILDEVPTILMQIDFIDKESYRFRSNRDLQSTRENPRLCYFLDVVREMDGPSHDLRAAVVFFNDVGIQQMVLYKDLQFLLTAFEDSSVKWHGRNEVEKDVKYIVNRAADFVKEWMKDNSILSEMSCLIDTLIHKCTEKSLDRKINLEAAVKSGFDGERGIHQYFSHISGEIQSIRRKIRQIRGIKGITLGLKTLQLQSSLPLKGHSLSDSNLRNIVVGFDAVLKKIVDRLAEPLLGREVLAIVGMGGIGKTTLARQMFDHPDTDFQFHCRAWVRVSQVYQLRNLLLDLLRSVTKPSDNVHEKTNEDLAQDLYQSLKGRKYLVVMDDVWSNEAWDCIQMCLPDDNNGSRVVVTSRFMELATYVSPKSLPHCMSLLDTKQSWELLEKLVFGLESCPLELVDLGKQIARKCHGLPLAIVVIAGTLSRTVMTSDCWKDVAASVSSVVFTNPEQCLDILALSYNYLPQQLKACFLYMGAFPEDYEIEVRKLFRLWIAEGFLEASSSSNLEDVAEAYLEDLIGRSLVLVGKRNVVGKIKSCRLHDLLRELCLREAQKENIMTVIKQEDQSFPAKDNQRHLILHLNSDADVHLAPPYRSLQSFLCFTLGSGFVPDIFFSYLIFQSLRVLDMFFLQFDSFPAQIVNLEYLTYLALNVTYKLPTALARLKNLQTLVINGPWPIRDDGDLPTLIVRYWSMPNLRHLHTTMVAFLSYITDAASNIYRKPLPLGYLKTLSTVQFLCCRRDAFANMPYLAELGLCETKEDYYRDRSCECLKDLAYLHQLEALNCSFYKEIREARTISWDAFPSNLRKLTLSASNLPWEDMTNVAKLPNLEVLKLKNYAFRGSTWKLTDEVFRCLKQLLIEKTDIVQWEAEDDHFPCLQFLILRSCEFLAELPYVLGEIPTLERIELHYCNESAELSAQEFKDLIEDLAVMIRN